MSTIMRRLALVLLCAVTPAGAGDAPQQMLASAGGSVVQGDLRLSYTLGEPVAGVVGTGDVVLSSGFQALFVTPAVVVFQDGFESTATPPQPLPPPSGAAP